MTKRDFNNLIEKYKRGECSPREKQLLELYLDTFQNKYTEWNEDEMGDPTAVGDKIYSNIFNNTRKEETFNFPSTYFSPLSQRWAASFILLICFSAGLFIFSKSFEKETISTGWRNKISKRGEKSTIFLEDGSKIVLNADSKLSYPIHFSNESRLVYLNGEAFFEINKITDCPFTVISGKISTTVLGTRFNVSTYPNKNIMVSLLEGKVKVERKIDKNSEINFLKPNDQLIFNESLNKTIISGFDSLEVAGWKNGIHKFENKTLATVLPYLERAFGVNFKFVDSMVLSKKITIKFENNSLQTVLDVLKSITGLQYRVIEKNNIKEEIVYYRNLK